MRLIKLNGSIIYENHNAKNIKVLVSEAHAKGISLSEAYLSGANLIGVNLSGADLSHANLSAADLIGANLRDANLSAADLSGANLSGADLRGANLITTDLVGADLRGAKTDKRYIQISCIGSAKRMTTYCFEDDMVWCGCFEGTLEEFEMQVKYTHNDNPVHLKEYLGFIEYVKSLKK